MEASVIYNHSHDVKLILKFFFSYGAYLKFEIVHKGEKYSLTNTSRMQNFEFVS